jgi:hypothetical protein
MGELQKIVDGADNRPLGAHLLEAAQQELAEAAGLFNLPKHRLKWSGKPRSSTDLFLNRKF